jgi:prepilin-type N-terminal cleavage/methylation domain-containing protein
MRKQRGFTLVEVAIALGVMGALATISIIALRGVRQRGNYASATGDVVGALRLARSESFSRGQAVYFIVDTNVTTDALGGPASPRWWVLLDVGGNFDFTAWDPANPAGLGDRVLSNGILPNGVTINAPSGYPKQLKQPYQLIPATSPAPAATPVYCSFCGTSGAKNRYGWVRFSPGSAPTATFTAGTTSSSFGQQLTLTTNNGTVDFTMVVAILARSGAVTTEEQP